MNPVPQPFAGQGRANGRNPNQRHSGELRSPVPMPPTNGNPPMAMPPRAPAMGNGQHPPGFQGARSPPNAKNTSHVPCKFFRQGTCQAGKACPFLHSEAMTPCKYFQKGNCKFGLKCANEHITADGRRVNKPGGYMMGPAPLNLGGRVMPPPGQGPPNASLLTMQQQDLSQPQPIPGAPSYMNSDMWRTEMDPGFSSLPRSNYGSPPADGQLPMSPPNRNGIGLTAANAQLPASFDSQGVSKFAREGPFAQSVPTRFGLSEASPPARPVESSALRNLHSSAFGDDRSNGFAGFPSSPPAEELGGRRILHSERFSRNNPRLLSASVGAKPPLASHEEWDDDGFAFEEDMVPSSLHDLLTPHERSRRFSRNAEDEPRLSFSGVGTPADASSKVGSPNVGSPSRFGALWAGRKAEGHDSSPFGPVGSPLKNSALHPGASPSLRATANARPLSSELHPISSPGRQASMSMISQQLQRTRLSERVSESQNSSSSPLSHPGMSRVASGSSVGSSPSGRLDRAVSSSSVGRDKIDEEPEELFSMDEIKIDDVGAIGGGNAWKGGNPFTVGKASPKLGPIGGQRAAKPITSSKNGV